MYYISEYEKNATKKVTPYLLEFPQIVEIIKVNSGRYQAIEDILWHIASCFKVDNASGIFLNVIANNEVVDIIYTDKANDAFTYGTDKPIYQAYGTGHFYSQASYISGANKTITDDKMIRAIKAKIIQNNTDGTIEDSIEALKLYFNAEKIGLYEYNPLGVSISLSGNNLEISSSGVYDTVKRMLPVCVNLNNIYINDKKYDFFKYNNTSSYGYTRYPMVLQDGISKYQYISKSINLTSENEEYIKTNKIGFKNNSICYIIGEFSNINNNATLLSCGGFGLQTIQLEDNKTYMCLKYGDKIYSSNIEVRNNTQYEIILYNDNGTLKLWIYEKINISGKLNKDTSYIYNTILNKKSLIEIPDFTLGETPIYINCTNLNDIGSDYADFIYHAILFGSKNESNIDLNEYYVTCYGEKHILFNCLENKNHLEIKTNSDLSTDLTVKQMYFNYRDTHSGNRYCYFDGKSGIDYYLSYENIDCYINNVEISFDICCPISISDGVLLSNFIGNSLGYNDVSHISLHKDGSICVAIPITTYNEETKKFDEYLQHFYTAESIIKIGEYSNIKIIINNEGIFIYKNNILQSSNKYDQETIFYNMPNILKLCYGMNYPSFKGIIKNLKFNIDGELEENKYNLKLDADLKNTLADNSNAIEYINKGARFISVPQLISNTNDKDIYNNNIISVR